jgi:hypothetical protein
MGIELGDLDGKDVVQSIKMEEMGMVQVDVPGTGPVWMTAEQASQHQDRQADNLRAAATEGFRRKNEAARIEETKRHNKATEDAAKSKLDADKDKGPNVSRGLRGGTSGERRDIAKSLMDDDDELSFKDAWAQAGEMVRENTRAQVGELGGGVVPGVKDKPKGDAFLEAMTPAKRAEYDALPPELQKRIREKAGGG